MRSLVAVLPLTVLTFTSCGPSAPEPARNRPAVQHALGSHTGCAVLDDGTVRCWGSNVLDPGTGPGPGPEAFARDRCLFHSGNPRIDLVPRDVPGVNDAVEVAVSDHHACARTRSGSVRCWGQNYDEVGSHLGSLTQVAEVGTGLQHSCARLATGSVRCWGDGQFGKLGDGMGGDSAAPVAVVGIDDAVQLAVGGMHACVLRSTGEVSCWGANVDGALGDGTELNSGKPVKVTGLSDVVELEAGFNLTCARTRAGVVSCWGKLPSGASPVTEVMRGDDLIGIRVGWFRHCVLRSNGTAECLGGEPGMTGVAPRYRVMPFTDMVELSIGQESYCARRSTGEVECLGQNICGELGDGSVNNRWDVTAVVPL